ncbi:MAG: protein kinase [Acidobacteria bacterium]|nr:protein kinase [Acidobacteriota bacterium]
MKECPRCGRCLEDPASRCPQDDFPLEPSLPGAPVMDGRYDLERRLGSGAMGAVYRARHRDLKKAFALKLIHHAAHANPQYQIRFRREAEALGKLEHTNIVRVTDYGVDPRSGGIPYLVTEYLEGQTLQQTIRDRQRLPTREALPLLDGIARAIDHAHRQGILHRDLKPGNVFLCGDPAAPSVKILDFGLARFVDPTIPSTNRPGSSPELSSRVRLRTGADGLAESLPSPLTDSYQDFLPTLALDGSKSPDQTERLTMAHAILGTPGYIAPEIYRGQEASAASDIYSFGVIIFETLTGQLPYAGNPQEIIYHQLQDPPRSVAELQPDLDPGVDDLLARALSKFPDQRPATATTLVTRLRQAFARAETHSWQRRETPVRRRWASAVALLTVVVSLLLSELPLIRSLENQLLDLRFQLRPGRAVDDRILLAVVDEASLQADPTPLPSREKADEFGQVLQAVFAAGARGVAIDFTLPVQWSRSEAFSSLVLQHRQSLVLAAYVGPDGQSTGWECLQGLTMLALGSEQAARGLFGLVNLNRELDGAVRRMDLAYRTTDKDELLTFPARAYQILEPATPWTFELSADPLWVDYTPDPNGFTRISWKDLPPLVHRQPELFAGRMLMVGGAYMQSGDEFFLALTEMVPGVTIQAFMLNTLLQGVPIRPLAAAWWLVPLGLGVFAFAHQSLLRRRQGEALVGLALLAGLYTVVGFALFIWAGRLLNLAAPLAAAAMAVGVTWLVRRRLAPFPIPDTEVND